MGFSSQAGKVGLKTQASKGVYADPGAVAPNQGVFMRIRSGALGGNRDLLIPDPEIGGNRDVPDAKLGPINFSGEYDFYVRMNSIATLLQGALGTAITTGTAATGYSHAFTPSDTTLPWLSVEETIAGAYEDFNYTDLRVNTLHLEADANGYLMGTVGLVGLKQEALAVPTVTPRWDISPLIVGTTITVNWGGVQLPAKSFSLDVNNNIEDDDFRLGSLFLGDAQPKRREITMGVTIRPEDSALWRTAMWGGPAATGPQGCSAYKDDVEIDIVSCEDVAGADPGVKYAMNIAIPSAAITPFAVSPSGDDVLEHDLELQALRPNPAVPILTASVVNDFATVA
jgi:hypothetical protein